VTELVVILFAVLSAPDGTKQVSNVAIVATEGACAAVAAELNASPRKPAEIVFACHVGQLPVKS
jgi:hypothetical protein